MINHVFITFYAVQIYNISFIHLHSSSSTGILRTHSVTSWLDGPVDGSVDSYSTVLIWQRSWFESYSSLNFFQALISHLLKLIRFVRNCDDQSRLHKQIVVGAVPHLFPPILSVSYFMQRGCLNGKDLSLLDLVSKRKRLLRDNKVQMIHRNFLFMVPVKGQQTLT